MFTRFKLTIGILFIGVLISRCDAVFEDDLEEVTLDLFSPSDGAELGNTLVQFQWDSVKEALEYDFQLATPSFSEENFMLITDTTSEDTHLTRILPLGEYEWRVKARNSSSESEFSVSSFEITGEGSISSLFPVIETPLELEFLNQEPVFFNWGTMSGATEYLVRVFNVVDGVQGEQILGDITTGSSYQLNLEEGAYLAQVQGSNQGIQFSQVSEVNFTVDRTAPSAPLIESPDGETYSINEDISFTWISGADQLSSVKDSLYVYTISPSSLVFKEEVSSGFMLNASELGVGNYDWSIITFDAAGNNSESSIQLFSVDE